MPQQKQESKNQTTTTAIAEYSATESALAELRQRLQGAKYEVTTTAGMDTAKKDRRELVTLRTDLEKERQRIKAPALERCRLIDAEAKRITGELLALEQPIDAQIKAEEDRKAAIKAEKERVERERIDAISERIGKIRGLTVSAAMLPNAGELEIFIARVEAHQIGAEFAEFITNAEAAKAETVAALKEMLTAWQAREAEAEKLQAEQEAEAARLEAIRIEQEKAAAAERERLAAEKAEQDRLRAIEEEKLRKEREELERLRAAELQRQKEADEKAAAERAEADRIAAEERARQQAIIDAEREALRVKQEEVERAERERIEAERLKVTAAPCFAEDFIVRIENYGFECEAGPLANCADWQMLKTIVSELRSDSDMLNALRAAGVDKWDGYDFALESMEVANG